LRATTATGRASGPWLPFKDTMERAGLGVAVDGLFGVGTCLATMEGRLENLAGALLDTTTTFIRAEAELAPFSDSAIYGAFESVAAALFCTTSAHFTTESGCCGDGTGAGLGAYRTRFGAVTPSGEFGHNTVHRASLSITNSVFS